MPNITIIGAGSVVFTRRLLGDLLSFPSLADSNIKLMDIDSERLELIAALGDQGRVVRLNQEVIYPADVYEEMEKRVIEYGSANETISLGSVREMFDTSRKYTLAVLEHMDRRQITRRVGDDRLLR